MTPDNFDERTDDTDERTDDTDERTDDTDEQTDDTDEQTDYTDEQTDPLSLPHVECVAPKWCWEYRECQSGQCPIDWTADVPPDEDDIDSFGY